MGMKCFQMSAVLFISILKISVSMPCFLSPVLYLMAPKILEFVLGASGFSLFKRAVLSHLFRSYTRSFVISYILS